MTDVRGGGSGSLQKRAVRLQRGGGGERGVRLFAKARVAAADGGGHDRCWGGGGYRPLEGGGGMRNVRGGRGGGGGADRPLEGGGGGQKPVGDRGSAAGSLKKRAAQRRVRLSERARGAVAGKGGGGVGPLLGGGGGLTDRWKGGGDDRPLESGS